MGLQEDWDSATPDLTQEWESAAPDSSASSPGVQAAPPPSMGDVAANAVPKAVAGAFQNAYDMAAQSFMGQVITRGLKAMQGDDLVNANPNMKGRAEEAGLVDKSLESRMTGPQKVLDATISSGVSAMLAPGGKGPADLVRSAIIGAASGAAGKTVENMAKGIGLSDTAAHWLGVATGAIIPAAPLAAPTFRAIKPAPQSPLNTKTRMETLRAGQEIGLVAQPTSVRPSVANQVRESIAGPGKLNLAASIQNQRAATEAGKAQLGLPPDAELVPSTFEALKREAGKPYRELEQLTGGKNLLEQVQQKRADAAAFWRANGNAPSPELRKAAMAAEQEAHQFEVAIDQLAQQTGRPDLLNRVRGARQSFGQIYDVEAATNVGDGHIVMSVLGGMKDAGRPLSGNLDTIGKWWNAFGPVSREGSKLGTVASGTDAASAALLTTTAASGGGSLLNILAGAAPGLRGWARNKSLSPEVQKSLLDMGGRQSLLELRPQAARGLSRAALIGSALHNTEDKER